MALNTYKVGTSHKIIMLPYLKILYKYNYMQTVILKI